MARHSIVHTVRPIRIKIVAMGVSTEMDTGRKVIFAFRPVPIVGSIQNGSKRRCYIPQ